VVIGQIGLSTAETIIAIVLGMTAIAGGVLGGRAVIWKNAEAAQRARATAHEALSREREHALNEAKAREQSLIQQVAEYRMRPDLATIQEMITQIANQIATAAGVAVADVVQASTREHTALLAELTKHGEVLDEIRKALVNGKPIAR
jgi:hypothetical protein